MLKMDSEDPFDDANGVLWQGAPPAFFLDTMTCICDSPCRGLCFYGSFKSLY